jgi:excisionase family DNA binding protein
MSCTKENSDNDRVLLNVREAADLLRLCPGTVYHLASRGSVPGVVRLSRRCLRFRRDALLQWITEQSNFDAQHSVDSTGRWR